MNAYDSLYNELAAAVGTAVLVRRSDLADLLAEVSKLRAAAPKAKPKKKAASAVDALPEWLPLDAWNAFLAMRKQIKKPATDYAQKLLIKKLTAFYAADLDPLTIINQSIASCWQDLYAPKEAGRGYGYDVAPARPGRAPLASQNAVNNDEALRLLSLPNFDDMRTIDEPI